MKKDNKAGKQTAETDIQTIRETYMREALKQARRALRYDEVPIGAVVVKGGKIIARAANRKERGNDATAHAEMLAVKKAQKAAGDWRLNECEIYVTLEPCAMCAGALINARMGGIVFGAFDARFGCCGSLMNLPSDPRFNHRCSVQGGVLEKECAQMLTEFFKAKR